jgi:RNA polymerase sigma-70 factor (ECF subfamily)
LLARATGRYIPAMNPPSEQPSYSPAYGSSEPRAARTSAQPEGPARAAAINAEDVELLRRMEGGDEAALGALYDRWSRPLHALALQMLREPAEAEEVVEETFWQVWRQAGRYEPARGAVVTWLLTIGRSRALDRARSLRRRREESLVEAAEHDPCDGADASPVAATDPGLSAEALERRELVVAALAELPREQREALELGYFGGFSQSEIAERTGLPLGTVKTRMRLALQKLRNKLWMLRDDNAPAAGAP